MRKLLTTFIFILVLVPFISSAAVLRTGETISVSNDQVVSDDFYAAGGTVSQSGDVEGDMYVAAASLTVTDESEIAQDLTVIGGSVQIHASVTDDIRVVGGEVVISGAVGGDVVVLGGLLKILSSARIEGDVLFFGSDLELLGPVGGSVMGTAEQVRIDAHVEESLDMTVGSLTLGDRAEVLGDVRYLSNQEINRSQNAVVVGEVVRNSAPEVEPMEYESYLIMFIILLFTSLLLQLLLRGPLTRAMPELTSDLGLSGLIGFAAFILLPIAAVVAMASVLGALFGVLVFFGFIILFLAAIALTPVLLGALVNRRFNQLSVPHVLYTVLAAALLQLLAFVPLFGPLLLVLFVFITLGAIVKVSFLAIRRIG